MEMEILKKAGVVILISDKIGFIKTKPIIRGKERKKDTT